MLTHIHESPEALGIAAATEASEEIAKAIAANGEARIVVATGSSQFLTIATLVLSQDIDWSKVTAFHLDEYIGLDANHPASFRKYLNDRLVQKLPNLKVFHAVNGDAPDLDGELQRLAQLFLEGPIHVACVGIGENAHLAFNDPPADFETNQVYLRVRLDEACRRQQVNEGWFPSLDETPSEAISMSIQHIMRCRKLIVSVPDERKAEAVRASLQGPVTPMVPASILQGHPDCTLFLDRPAASRLTS